MQKGLILPACLCLVALAAADAVSVTPATGNRQSAIVDGADAITVPQIVSYQGKLTDTAGRAVRDSSYGVTFRLYSQSGGGTAYWTEAQTVATRGGLFTVLLGSVTPVFFPDDGHSYLSMQVDGSNEMTPRIRIVSAAYALSAGRADSAYRAGSAPAQRPISPGVGNAEIAANAVTTDKVQDGSLRGADFDVPCSLYCQAGNPYAALMIRAVNTGNGIRIDTADNVGIIVSGTRHDGIIVASTHGTGVYSYHSFYYGVRGSGRLAGGYFQAESAQGEAVVARSYNNSSTDTAIRAYGKGIATGGWSTGFDDGEAPGVVSDGRMMLACGSARLSGGHAEVSLPDLFVSHVRPDVPVRLGVTPTEDAPGLLVAERSGSDRFAVRLRRIAGLDGRDDASFDWMAVGVLEEPSSEPVPEPEEEQ